MSNITTKPVKPNSVEFSKLTYSAVKSLPSGAKLIYLNHNGGQLFVQTPEMNIPFDSGTYYAENDNSGKYSIKVAMDDLSSNPEMKEFHDMLEQLDEKIMNDGIENSFAWFKKKNPNEAVIRELYTPMVKVSVDRETGEPNGKWAPQMQFKIVKRDGKVLCDCYDSSKNLMTTSGEDAVDLETMFKKGTKVKMILKCNGLWVASGKFGCTWKAEQIRINAPNGISGYAFDSDEEDEGVPLSRQDSVAPTVRETSKVPETSVQATSAQATKEQDNYVESESESESEEEEEPEPKPVKKTVKRKKTTKKAVAA